MEERSLSPSSSSALAKVLPVQTPTLLNKYAAYAVASGSSNDDCSSGTSGGTVDPAMMLSPSDVAVSCDAATAPSAESASRSSQVPIHCLRRDSYTGSRSKDSSMSTLRRRAHSFTIVASATLVTERVRPRPRRHSSGMTRTRPATVSIVKEPGDSFFNVFGKLGMPMVIAFIFSALAMFGQAYVQLRPSEFANLVMNTSAYDEGEFWLLDRTDAATVAVATGILVLFGCLYLVLVAYMLFFRHLAIEKKLSGTPVSPSIAKGRGSTARTTVSSTGGSTFSEVEQDLTVSEIAKGVLLTNLEMLRSVLVRTCPCLLRSRQQHEQQLSAADIAAERRNAALARKKLRRARDIYFQFSDIDGTYHAYYSAMYDLPKLAFQTMSLVIYLRKGFPITIVAFYCTMLTVNWLISFYRFQRKTFDRALLVARVFYLFDLFFAVFAPLLILVYSYSHFDFDRDAFRTQEESFPPGDFESTARLFADPTQISIIRLGFSHLTLTTGSTIGMKVGLLYLSIYKWRKIIRFLVQSHHKSRRQLTEIHTTKKRKQTRHHLAFGVTLFLVFGAGILMYTIGALTSCAAKCADLKNCVVISYRWQYGSSSCPCLVYISRRLDPRTFDEWLYPDDVTESLGSAAKEGTLKSIQIVNRALSTLPNTLRRCTSLQQLILIYTETEQFPDWVSELTHLEYIHIEGDFTGRGLKHLPLDMFSRMHNLQYLLTGTIPHLPTYPSLTGLTELKRLAITSGHSLTALPSLDDLTNLRSLNLVENYHMRRLPSLQALTKLRSFNVVYRNEMCCNGYLTDVCDQQAWMCRAHANESIVECVSDAIPAADRAVIEHTVGQVCVDVGGRDLMESAPTLVSTDIACAGVMYRQCQVGNITGICYNVRLQVVTCDTSGGYERMRRLQIQRGVGSECDPVEEAWLGCEPS